MSSQFEIVFKVLAAFVAGVVIGLDRERSGKSAGIRTQMVVCVGSALLAGISVHLRDLFPSSNADPARLMAQIVSGVGFLGVGVIFKNGNKISGLTTAATIWTTSAVGIAIGSGFYLPAIVTTGLILLLNPMAHFQYIYGLKGDFYFLSVPRRQKDNVRRILQSFRINERSHNLQGKIVIFTLVSSQQRNTELEKYLEKHKINYDLNKVNNHYPPIENGSG